MNAYEEIVSYILPNEIFESFEVVRTEADEQDGEKRLHIYLEEKNHPPSSPVPLYPNGFYESSSMTDFPIPNHKTLLHVCRRRWKDAEGNSYSNDWQFVAKGTRISTEFALFLKPKFP